MLTFDINGMTCGGCTAGVQRALANVEGVSQVGVTLSPGLASVVADLNCVTAAEIESIITRMGFTARVRSTAPDWRSP